MPTHRLTPDDLTCQTRLARIGARILVFDEIDSTNAWLLREAGRMPDGTIVAAEFQTAGRGRLGRFWQAPRGSSVLLSVLLFEPDDSPLLRLAALLASLAACEALDECTDLHPCVRWPNDLVLNGRKLGGVLAESSPIHAPDRANPAGARPSRALVIGVGLNCLQQPGHLGGDLAERATSLEIESDQPIDRAAIARGLIARIDRRLAMLHADPNGTIKLMSTWRARCVDVGTRARLVCERQTFEGTIVDVADDADLVIELDHGGRRRFGSATTTRFW